MFHVHIGSDTYGRVKVVGGTPIITRFFMASAFPLWPLESYYFAGFGETKREGIPLLFSWQDKAIHGFPLARVSRISALMAYFRGLCGALILVGCMVIVPIIMVLTGEHLDEFARLMVRVLFGCLIGGILLGALSYWLPFRVSQRERLIRSCCGEILGICADPAFVQVEHAQAIALEMAHHPDRMDDVKHNHPSDPSQRLALQLELVHVRARIGSSAPSEDFRRELESQTDDLLERLRH